MAKVHNGPGSGGGRSPVKCGPGTGGPDVKGDPDMKGHKGLAGAYGMDDRTTESEYGKKDAERKDFYW